MFDRILVECDSVYQCESLFVGVHEYLSLNINVCQHISIHHCAKMCVGVCWYISELMYE